MQLSNPGLTNLRREAQTLTSQPSDWTYWIQKGLQLLGSASPTGGATMALQGAMPQTEAASGASLGAGRGLDVMTVLAALVPLAMGKAGGKAQQEAMAMARQLVEKFGVAPDDMLRLFRGSDLPYTSKANPAHPEYPHYTVPARQDTMGRWYTPDPGNALEYTPHMEGPVWAVDVPKAEAEQFWVPNQPRPVRDASFDWAPEYVVPPEVAARARQVMPHTPRPPERLSEHLTSTYREQVGLPEPMELEEMLRRSGWGIRLQQEQQRFMPTAEDQAGPDYLNMLRGLYKELQVLK